MWLGEHLLKPTKKKSKYSMATSSTKTGCVVLAIILLSQTGFLRDKPCFGVPSYASALAAQILNLVQKYFASPSTVQRKTFQFLFSNYFSGPKISLSSFLCIQESKKIKRELMKHMWRKGS